MKRILSYIMLLAFGFLSACTKPGPYEGNMDHVMIYMGSAYNNLSSNIRHDLVKELCEGDLPSKNDRNAIIAFVHNTQSDGGNYKLPHPPCLIRAYKDRDKAVLDTISVFSADLVDASAETVKDILDYIKRRYPSNHYGLVYSSHGTGWMPCQAYGNNKPAPAPKSIGAQFDQGIVYTYEIDIKDFAAAIPMHLDYLVMDACLMGGAEVAYELRNVCDRIVASPAEIPVAGLYYKEAAARLLRDDPDLEGICKDYMSHTGWTIGLYECSKLEALATVCRTLNNKYRSAIANVEGFYVQDYYTKDKHWFYDLQDIYKVAGVNGTDLAALQSALKDAVLHHQQNGSYPRACGMSMYLPSMGSPELDAYYRGLAWNKATGLVE